MLKKTIYVLITLFLLNSCSTILPQFEESQSCKTRYPILLVHGIGIRDDLWLLDYWGDIPESLIKEGAQVYLAGHGAWNTIESNGEALKQRIEEILEQTGAEKINMIAHSKGGLDSRYMISQLGMEDKVASLTTINTPHRGSSMADIAMGIVNHQSFWGDEALNAFHWLFWREDGTAKEAGAQLSPDYLMEFNKTVIDSPKVYYQSYSSHLSEDYPEGFWRSLYSILKESEGENDGLVSIESAKWGNYKGEIISLEWVGISHKDVIGLPSSPKVEFDVEAFYKGLVMDLKRRGY